MYSPFVIKNDECKNIAKIKIFKWSKCEAALQYSYVTEEIVSKIEKNINNLKESDILRINCVIAKLLESA